MLLRGRSASIRKQKLKRFHFQFRFGFRFIFNYVLGERGGESFALGFSFRSVSVNSVGGDQLQLVNRKLELKRFQFQIQFGFQFQ